MNNKMLVSNLNIKKNISLTVSSGMCSALNALTKPSDFKISITVHIFVSLREWGARPQPTGH